MTRKAGLMISPMRPAAQKRAATGGMSGFFASLCAFAICLTTLPVHGQINSLSNPATLERALEDPKLPEARTTKPLSLPESSIAPQGADEIRFTLESLSIRGGTLFDVGTILALDAPQTGQEISLSDIYDYADTITQHYRQAGYALSFALIPAQEITNGLVQLEIIEGRIDELVIRETNLSDLARRHILTAFDQFAQKGITKTHDLENFLIAINGYPGITAKGVISPGAKQGSSALILNVMQRTQSATLGYQNYLSESLGRDVFLADIALLGQWTGRDEAKISVRQAPDKKAYHSVAFDYSSYVDDTALEVYFRASESKTRPKKGALADLDFNSSAYSQQIGAKLPLWQRRKSSLFVGGSVNVNDSASRNGTTPSTTDKTRSVTLYADYESDLKGGASQLFHVEIEQGAKFFHARANGRQGANLHHTILRASERYRQPLKQLENGQVDATLRLFAQATLSENPTFANAECAFGGRGFGIGMDAGTLSGEHCLLVSAQVNWQRPFIDLPFLPSSVFTFFGRLDMGAVRQQGTLVAGEERQQEAISAAIGGQFVMTNGMTVNIEQATQLKNEDSPALEGESKTNIAVNMPF